MGFKNLITKAIARVFTRNGKDSNVKIVERSHRGFNSAKLSHLTSSWAMAPQPIDVDIKNGLRRLRARARAEAQNNDHVRKFLTMLKTNVIGHQGIVLKTDILDPSGVRDIKAGQSITEAWREWGRKGSMDVTGRYSWRMFQRLYIETLGRDGEVLVRKIINWAGNKYRFALQFLDVDLLDVEYNDNLSNGNIIRMGVELDQYRRPVAYHLLTTNHGADTYMYAGRRYVRIPANQIIHEYLSEWVWQTRGIPLTATALLRLNMLSEYEEAELVAARYAASKFANYERNPDAPTPQDGVSMGDSVDADGNFVDEVEPGIIGITPEGYTLKPFDPQHPNQAYKDFVKASLRGIAAGLGVSYNDLADDLEGVNYSSLRHGAITSRDVWRLLQDWVIESLCDRVYRDWLHIALITEEIKVSGKPLKLDRETLYQRVNWQPRGWQWVDPAKEVAAHRDAHNMGLRSISSIIREQGNDPDEVWREIAEERKKMSELGITTATAIEGNPVDDNEEENDAENE